MILAIGQSGNLAIRDMQSPICLIAKLPSCQIA